jgi:hypothetical protein
MTFRAVGLAGVTVALFAMLAFAHHRFTMTLPNGTPLGNPNAALSANAGGANP